MFSGRVLPYQGLPHTERIDAFATDCQRTLFIATCCANGTISLWKRVSAKQLVPVFVCPSLKNISVISMAVQPKLGTQTADILCHDVTKALVISDELMSRCHRTSGAYCPAQIQRSGSFFDNSRVFHFPHIDMRMSSYWQALCARHTHTLT